MTARTATTATTPSPCSTSSTSARTARTNSEDPRMKRHLMKRTFLALLLAAGASNAAQAKLRAFACEPEWGSLLQELAGDAIDVDVATTGLQDVHQIEAKPSLIAKVRKADRSEEH